MPLSRLIARLAIMPPLLLSFPAALARNEEMSALLAVLLGCAVIVFNKQFTRGRLRSAQPALRSRIRRATGEVDQDSERDVRHRFRGVERDYPVGVRAHERLEQATPGLPI
jgi:hypothetical protein